jgi:hypothetical protein
VLALNNDALPECAREAMQIPIHRGHLLRFDRGQATDLIAATIPI